MMNPLKMNASITVLLALGLAGFTACEQNPYPKDGKIKESLTEARPPEPAYALEMDGSLDCIEGENCKMTILGHVPRGEEPVLEFSGLPPGATYDDQEGVFSFTPGFDVVDVSIDPLSKTKIFPVRVILRAKGSSKVGRSGDFVIVVKNSNRDVNIQENQANVTITEGTTGIQKLVLNSLDIPNGPFIPMLSGQPDGMSISQKSNQKEFEIKYTPSRRVVTGGDQIDQSILKRKKEFNFKAHFSLPNGQTAEKDLTWFIIDDYVGPFVSAPASLEQGPVVNFTIRVEDLNGETAPLLDRKPTVSFGRLTVSALESNPGTELSLPNSLFSVTWDQLTSADIGKVQDLNFEFCGKMARGICTDHQTKVTITGNTHLKPVMDRREWPVSKLQSTKLGATLTVPLSIQDGEDSRLAVGVKVLPESMAQVVSWANGRLQIKPTAEGVQQFTIEVTSVFEQKISEGFLLDVLPKDWNSTVILTGFTPSTEATSVYNLLGGGEILSAAYQLNDGSTRLRETLIVTTEAFNHPDSVAMVEKYRAKFKTIIFSSPLIANSAVFKSELAALGLVMKARLSDDILRYTLVVNPRSNLDIPKIPAGLQGTTTAASLSPQVFEVGRVSDCETVLSLQKPAKSLPVGAVCKKGSQKLIVLGFEISDLLLSSEDQDIGKSWLTTWMKGAR